MAKKSTVPATDPKKSLTLRASDYPGKSQDRVMAELSQSPIAGNVCTSMAFSKGNFGELGITDAIEAMRGKVEKVQAGSMADMESLLVAQATSLDAIFNELARRSALNMGEYLDASERYMRLALKAQAQSRATVEALAEVKNPRAVAFVKQANIAHGPQQVNNGAQPTRTEETIIPSNELSGAGNELLPDTRASQAASRVNQEVEAVGAINRAKN